MTTPKPRSPEYFDGWYADKADTTQVAEIMNRHMGLPPDAQAGSVPSMAISEIVEALRLQPDDVLLDLACGRGWYGLEVAARAGARLIGVDFSAEAVRQAADQARARGSDAEFMVGELTASGLPDRSVNAVLCTDSIQFPDEPAAAYRELRRVLVPGGRVVLTSWEPALRGDERLSERMRRVDLGAGLRGAGFVDVEVMDRPQWLECERAMWDEAIALDPEAGPALRSFHDEGVRSLKNLDRGLYRRAMASATAP
jgi:SAM-dependent methyltransferase